MVGRCLVAITALIAVALAAQQGTPSDAPPQAGAATFRDPLKQPFASTSIWNMPIGSGAVYTPAEIQQATDWGMTVDPDIIILEPDTALTPVYYNGDGWTGGSRCVPGEYLYSVPMPAGYVIPGASPQDTPNNAAAVLMPDGHTVKQMQPLTRCTAGGPATALVTYPDVDLYGDGIPGAHGGSGLSSIGGTIRLGELVPGSEIRHALKINVDATELWGGGGARYRWPADHADTPNYYSGEIAAMKMGALLALPATLDINALALETEPARMLAWTLQNYGGYIVDTTGWNVYALAVEHSPDGMVEAEFQQRWGFSMIPFSRDNPWSRDMDRIFAALHVVDNNAPGTVGGGGTPRQPLAPPLGTDTAPSPTPQPTPTATPIPDIDSDADGRFDRDDNCDDIPNADQLDSDGDGLGDDCEISHGAHPFDADTDKDGCLDGPEVRVSRYPPALGGHRDPAAPDDFFDVTGDRAIDITDVIAVLEFYGDAGTSEAGNRRDRWAPDASQPWRTVFANDGIDLTDAVTAIASFGHDCSHGA